jgi:FkbM family methyltransferase
VRYPPFGADLVALFAALGVDCVLDVGAFHGTYGRMLRDLGYRGRMVSFEPASENFKVLAHEAAGDHRWDVQQVAMGSSPATLDLLLTGSPGCNSLLPANDFARRELPRMFELRGREQVEVITIDSVYDDLVRGTNAVFVKIDTQGFDLEVLRGAARSLERIAALQIELALQTTYEQQPAYLDVLSELKRNGFHPAQLFPTYSDSAGHIAECDCVLIR